MVGSHWSILQLKITRQYETTKKSGRHVASFQTGGTVISTTIRIEFATVQAGQGQGESEDVS